MRNLARHWTTLPSFVLLLALVGCNSAPKSDSAAGTDAKTEEQGSGTGAASAGAQSAPELGQARSYAVFGGSTVTNTGLSLIHI